MASSETPIVNENVDVNNCLTEAQAALDILRRLQTRQYELNTDPTAAFSLPTVTLNQTQQALEQITMALSQEQDRRIQAEAALSESEERFLAIIDSFPVAIGVTGMDGVPLYINKVYQKLLGYTSDEIVKLKANDLYWDPADRLSMLSTLQKDGSVKEIEVQLKRKDGTPFWALLSAIKANFGGKPALVGTFLDINSRKEMESSLIESEQVYSAIFTSSPFALSLTRMPEGTLVDVNQAFLTLFGYSRDEVIGKTSAELHIADDSARALVTAEFKKLGSLQNYECTRQTKSGATLWLSLNLNWVSIGGKQLILTTIRDITDRKAAELALASSTLQAEYQRKRLSAVLEALPVGVAILDDKGGNIQGNLAFERVWGSPLPATDSVKDYQAYEAWWADTGQPVQPEEWASAQAVQKGRTVTGQVMKIQRFDGTFAYIHNSGAPIFDQQGKVVGSAVAIQDITELKHHEGQVQKLNRTLRALSNSNQAMLHATDEQGLLDEACRIVVKDCGYAMTWIGYAEHDKKKTVRPVASAGFDQGYLATLKITWANTVRGRGPTGTAIRTKKTSRCNNMLTDPTFAPWREAALKHGYASSIVLPLVHDGHAFGAINIYSCEPDAFSDEEEMLLTELAGDLAFGITTLRLRADQALTQAALRQSEAHYRNLFDNMSEGFALHEIVRDAQGKPCDYRFLEANASFERQTGLKPKEIAGRLASELLPGLEGDWVEKYGQVALSGEPTEFENYTSALGKYYRVYAYSPAPRQFATIVMDITEHKHADERLAYLASFPENNPRPILEIDMNGHILYANPVAIRIFPDLMERQTYHEYLANLVSMVNQIGLKEEVLLFRDVAVGDRFYEQSINYLPARRLIRIYGADITERKLAEHALRTAHDELEQRVLERTEALNNANHQLRAEITEREKAQTELESSLQELQVIEEELRNNNEMLLDAQKVLDTERQRYQDLFDFAPDSYLVTDSHGQILEANQYAYTLLEIEHNLLIGKPLMVFIARADHLAFSHLLNSLSSQGDVRSHELRLLPRKGPEVTVSVTVASIQDHAGKSSLRWTLRDITESKRAQEIIRQNSLRNEVLSEVSKSLAEASLDEKAILDIVAKITARLVGDSCVITLLSPDGQWLDPVVWWHKKPEAFELMSALYGTTHNPVTVGHSGRVFQSSKPLLIKELPPSDAQESIPADYRRYLDSVGVTSVLIAPILIGLTPIGTLGITRDTGNLPYTEDDQLMMEILANRVGQAIHNARLYQELQNSLRKELETHDQLVQTEKFAAVGRLLASITHEINNPLQTIKNCLYLSQMDTSPGTPASDALNIALAETNRLSNLVAQLREIYRPPTLGLSQLVNLPGLVDEVHTLLAGFLQEKHIEWEVTAPDTTLLDAFQVQGVPDQLKQVFLNISINAVDAMESDGGRLMIDFKQSTDQDYAGVCFRDTGPGLKQEIKEKLFEPFSTTKEKGLGLGLVICYDIIQKHHGQIEVESDPGQGAAFTVWLPAERIIE